MSVTLRALGMALLLAATACRQAPEEPRAPGPGSGDSGLAVPAGSRGSVTGMPDPSAPLPPQPTGAVTDPAATQDALATEATDASPNGDAPSDAIPPDAADPAAAAAGIVQDYYAAINAGEYGRAHALWDDGGAARGQTLEQFAAGFAQTREVRVMLQPATDLEGAAGSQFIRIPVTLEATQRDGSLRRYAGSYVLQRSMVDGATAEQREWRIDSASLQEVGIRK